MDPKVKLIQIANAFVGTLEKGYNKGPLIEEFQKAVDGVASGEPYCAGFARFCINKVDKELGIKTWLYNTEFSLALWDKSPKEARVKPPIPGSIIIWQFFKFDKPQMSGHVGIVTAVHSKDGIIRVDTIEGNTSRGDGINREGDGVWARNRSITGDASMRVLGFLNPWKY